jgi:hypothetical protein
MSFPARETYELLTTLAVGTQAGSWPIKIGPPTTTPDELIAVTDAPGRSPNPKWLLDFPAVQIIVRGKNGGYATAYAKAQAVKDAMLGKEAHEATGGRWDGVTMMGDINYVGVDENSRPIFSMNFSLIREPNVTPLTNREPLPEA